MEKDNRVNYYRLSMDYDSYNFSDFREEYDNEEKEKPKKTVRWFLKGNKPYMKENDTIFIYCSNMPDRENRFIIRAKVKKVVSRYEDPNTFDKLLKRESISPNEDRKSYILLGDIEAIKYESNSELSTEEIKKYRGFGGFQGIYGEITNKKLCDILTHYPSFDINELLSQYVDGDCFFKNLKPKDNNYMHSTFTKDNGVTYVEWHHFIFNSKGNNQNDTIKKDLNESYNFFRLCPTCHRKIHYAKKKERQEMIDYILEDARTDTRKLQKLVSELDKNKKLKEYVYDLYKINEED